MTTPGGIGQRLYVELAANTAAFTRDMRVAAAEVRAVDGATAKAAKGIGGMKLAAAGVGTALAVGAAMATRELVGLDKAMRNVQSITKVNEATLQAMTDEVVNLSRQLPQSSTTLAEGLYDIASSGFQGADGLKVLNAAAVAASAGMTNTAVSAQAISSVLNAYKKPAQEAADVSDVLFSTVNLGVTTFEQLSHNLGDYIGLAQTVGVEFEETGSAIATMTLNGINAAQAGTALGAVLSKMVKPGDELKQVMAGLGYESGTAMVEALGLRGALMGISEATGGTAEGMSAAFEDVQALRGALALTSNGGEKWAEVAGQMEGKTERAGAAAEALAEQSKGAAYQLTVMKNQAMATALDLLRAGLPIFVAGLQDVRDGARDVGEVLGDLADRLGPAWQNLREILSDLGNIAGDLTGQVWPLAQAFAAVAAGPVILGVSALAEVLSMLTGFLADNEVAATALAIAIGITLLGGVNALVTRIGVALVMAFMAVTDAMIAATGGAAALRAGLSLVAVSAAAATAGISVALAAVAVGWQQAGDALGAYDAAQEAIGKADSLQSQLTAMQEAATAGDDLRQRMEELRDRGFLRTLPALHENIEALKLWASGANEDAEAAANLEVEMGRLQGWVVSYLASTTDLNHSSKEFYDRFIDAAGATATFADAMPMLEAAGVRVGDSYEVVSQKIAAYEASQNGAAGATDGMVDALGDVAAGATTTEEAVEKLSTALDALMGRFLDADEAAIGFEQALDDMDAKLREVDENGKRLSTTLDTNTQRGRDNKTAIMDVVESLRQHVESALAAGAGAEELTGILGRGRERLLETAEAAGISAGEMDALLTRYNLTPELVDTIVQALGTQQAAGQVQGVQDKANTLDETVAKPGVQVQGVDQANEKLTATQRLLGILSGTVATPKVQPPKTTEGLLLPGGLAPKGDGPGHGGGGNVLSRVKAMLPAGARITSTWRSARENAAIGGSPTSYHLDKNNPAVDVAAPLPVMRSLLANARRLGGWRELLGPGDPGHSDHVHFAAAGGPITGPGSGTSDSIPAWLSNGEHVWTAQEVQNAGGHSMVEAIRDQYRYAAGGPVAAPAPPAGFVNRGAGTLTGQVVAMTDVAAIQAATAAWEAHDRALQRNAERGELLAAVQAKEEGALERLRDFDVAAFREDERASVDALVASLQAEQVAREEAARAAEDDYRRRVEVNNNLYELGRLSTEDHLANLDRRMARETEASAEWMSLYQQRQQVLDDLAAKEEADYRQRVERNNNLYDLGKISTEDHLGNLDRRMAREQRYSAEWMALYRQREQVLEDVARKEQEAADAAAQAHEDLLDKVREADERLNELLAEEAAVMADLARSAEEFAGAQSDVYRDQAEAQADYVQAQLDLDERRQAAMDKAAEDLHDTQARIVADRRDALVAWAALDEVGGNPWGNTAEQLIGNAQAQLAQFQSWMDELAKARARGLSEQVIGALGLDKGPQALGQLEQLNAATLEEVAALNTAVVAQTELAGRQVAAEQAAGVGTMVDQLTEAQREYAGTVEAVQREYVDAMADLQAGYAEQVAELQQRLRDLQAAFTAEQQALVAQLGQIGNDQGTAYGAGIAAGAQSMIPAVQAAVQQLQALLGQAQLTAAAAAALASAPMTAGGSGGPGTITPAGGATYGGAGGIGGNGAPLPSANYGGGTTTLHPQHAGTAMTSQYGTTYHQVMQGLAENASSDGTISQGWLDAQQAAQAGGHVITDANGVQHMIVAPGTTAASIAAVYNRPRTYDVGGTLEPGYTLAYNGTGANEYVHTAPQLERLVQGVQGAGPVSVRVFIGDRELTDIVDVRIDSNQRASSTAKALAGRRP